MKYIKPILEFFAFVFFNKDDRWEPPPLDVEKVDPWAHVHEKTPPYPFKKVEKVTKPMQKEILKWDTQKQAWHSVRVLCDEMGLTFPMKNILCATIFQESEFINYKADGTPLAPRNIKPDGTLGSTDYGIVQCNDKAHIGPGKTFPSVEYVMNNPEKMVRWMIGIYKKTGRLDPWYGYYDPKTKTYPHKKYLPLTSKMWKLAEK